MKEHILCAAIHFDDGVTYVHSPDNIDTGFVICGRRHYDCFSTVKILSGVDKIIGKEKVQGFMTNTNRFVNRQEAFEIAKWAGQIENFGRILDKDAILMSEDLY